MSDSKVKEIVGSDVAQSQVFCMTVHRFMPRTIVMHILKVANISFQAVGCNKNVGMSQSFKVSIDM